MNVAELIKVLAPLPFDAEVIISVGCADDYDSVDFAEITIDSKPNEAGRLAFPPGSVVLY